MEYRYIEVCVCWTIGRLTFLRSPQPALPFTHLITGAHQYLAQALFLPRGEHEDTREVVVIPAHFLFAEEPYDLALLSILLYIGRGRCGCRCGGEMRALDRRHRVVRNEYVVQERCDVVEDGFRVEEEFCEEGEVLRVELPIHISTRPRSFNPILFSTQSHRLDPQFRINSAYAPYIPPHRSPTNCTHPSHTPSLLPSLLPLLLLLLRHPHSP